jgi:hypothetical protein
MDTKRWLNDDAVLNPVATPERPTDYTLTVTDAHNCSRSSTVTSRVWEHIRPEITTSLQPPICSCDTIVLDGGPDYVRYLWSTGSTERSISTNRAGKYWFWAEDPNGCKGWSDTLDLVVIEPKSTIGLPAVMSARPGEQVSFPVKLLSRENLDYCALNSYLLRISFNKTLLAPSGNTPAGYIAGDKRIIEISGNRAGDTLATLDFIATLGESEQTGVEVETFLWEGCPAGNRNDESAGVFARWTLHRRRNKTLQGNPKAVRVVQPRPNPSTSVTSFAVLLEQPQKVTIVLRDVLGRVVQCVSDCELQAGSHEFSIDVTTLAEGTYVLSLSGMITSISQLIQVAR